MTDQGQRTADPWRERDYARQWASRDGLRTMLDLPRRMAAAIVASDGPPPRLVMDVASGPGDVLAAFLDEFPTARGLWTDASPAMLELARERLGPFGDRVEYRIVDMTDLASGLIPTDVDVIATSRATHHLDRAGLFRFYADAARLLTPGGWLINLDHVDPGGAWQRRLRVARERFRDAPQGPRHRHDHGAPSLRDHLEAYAAAGVGEVEVVWRAFLTCLIMGRRHG